MIEILKAVLFGIIQGVTEWLPVSSTGHMILLNNYIKLGVSEEFYKMFETIIQLGSIMAVIIIFWDKLWPFKSVNSEKYDNKGSLFKPGLLSMWIKIIVACIPAVIIGLFFDDLIDALFYYPVPVAIALIVVGIAFIVVENTIAKKTEKRVNSISEITYKDAVIIGCFQALAAIFPGTSRSGSTIIGGLVIGLSRSVAAEFTFFLAVPVMLGASLLKTLKYILKVGFIFSGMDLVILVVGTLVAFVVSFFVIKFLMGYIKKHDFKIFGWYRIILGIIVILNSILM